MPLKSSKLANIFDALALDQPPGSPGSRFMKKAQRAAEYRGLDYDSPAPAAPAAVGRQGSSSSAGPPPVARQQQQQQQEHYCLALRGDNLLVALDSDGRTIASFTVDGPAAAADEEFLALVRQEMARQQQQGQQQQQQQQQRHQNQQQGRLQQEPGESEEEEEEWHSPASRASDDVEDLMSLLLGGGGGSAGAGSAAAVASKPSAPRGQLPASAFSAASQPPAPLQPPGEDCQLVVGQAEAAAAQSRRASTLSCSLDGRLARQLQCEDDSAAAAAQAAAAEERVRDEQLARQWQEEEDARLAAALAAEEDTAAAAHAAAKAAASSRNYWSALSLDQAAPMAAAPAWEQAPARNSGAGSTAAPNAFPSLEAAPGGGSSWSGGGTTLDLRDAILAQHRSSKQRHVERGTGVRLLNKGQSSGLPPMHPGSSSGGWHEAGGGGGGLPPLQLEGGLVVLEDDLDYQLLLRDDGVTAAAKAAAMRHAEQEEAASAIQPVSAAASAEAMRSMIEAASRSSSRPGSVAGPVGGACDSDAEGGPCAAMAAGAATISGGAAAFGRIEVEPVDTKSLRRVVEDMKRRGWVVMPGTGGGHIRCERCLPDLGGFKQVYFLCSTPSDVAYIHNVAAAIKRFDREIIDKRQQQAAEAEAAAAAIADAARRPGSRPGN